MKRLESQLDTTSTLSRLSTRCYSGTATASKDVTATQDENFELGRKLLQRLAGWRCGEGRARRTTQTVDGVTQRTVWGASWRSRELLGLCRSWGKRAEASFWASVAAAPSLACAFCRHRQRQRGRPQTRRKRERRYWALLRRLLEKICAERLLLLRALLLGKEVPDRVENERETQKQ